ncbi:MAG TPA: hypothetical protein PLW35_09795 [Verrucomicrobiota bacterium]|nr:hypothetical protein [Verrucomicrobiota bacterium]
MISGGVLAQGKQDNVLERSVAAAARGKSDAEKPAIARRVHRWSFSG